MYTTNIFRKLVGVKCTNDNLKENNLGNIGTSIFLAQYSAVKGEAKHTICTSILSQCA